MLVSPVLRMLSILLILTATATQAASPNAPKSPTPAHALPTPEAFLGFKPGADYKLAGWTKIEQYFRLAGKTSDRVRIEDLGRSSDGRPMILAIVSAAETLRDLERHRANQHKIADPRLLPDKALLQPLANESQIVVLVNCGLHSNECVSTQTSMELLHELVTGESARAKEIRQRTIVLLVPSANPDGTDMIADWYYRTLGKPWEGAEMPWLYHKYSGHDNNRDWFALNLQETRNLSRVLYHQWFPTIVLDLHQQASHSVRMALPPYHNPINPNIPTLVNQAQLILGGHMGTELSRQGKTGAAYNVNYDLWYHGAFRSSPNRHNMVGILTEAASTRLATPVFIPKSDLKGASRGLPEYAEAVNFSDPWPGGWWRMRDILEYQMITSLALLSTAARHHDLFQSNLATMASEAIELGRSEPPFAWLVPDAQPDRGAVVRMLRSLHGAGIEVHRAAQGFQADGRNYSTGTYILYCAQPYRPHLMDMMERQEYPHRTAANGKPETPYDIAGWTLPLQMGVRVVPVASGFEAAATKLAAIDLPESRVKAGDSVAAYMVAPASNDDFRLMHRLHRKKIAFSLARRSLPRPAVSAGTLVIPSSPLWQEAHKELLDGLGLTCVGLTEKDLAAIKPVLRPARAPRVALYQPWTANMDEGWTRLVLEQFEFPYTSLHNAEIRAGNLRDRFDCILLPSISASQILNGRNEDASEPQYTGGIEEDGALRLQEFVLAGGSLVCIDESCGLPLTYFNVPVRNALMDDKNGKRVDRDRFYCPGSLLGVVLDPTHPLCWGKPSRVSGYFVNSQAFDLLDGDRRDSARSSARRYPARVVARYADTLLLESGYLQGEQFLADKAAVVDVTYGQGHVVLFGFRVQHRAHTYGTYRLLFNAIESGER